MVYKIYCGFISFEIYWDILRYIEIFEIYCYISTLYNKRITVTIQIIVKRKQIYLWYQKF